MTDENNKQDYILVEGDDMEISIVKTRDESTLVSSKTKSRKKKWYALVAVLCVLVIGAMIVGWMGYHMFVDIGVPISRTPKENIDILKQQMARQGGDVSAGVTYSRDSILGVAMDFYRLDGLRGTLSMTEPDMSDKSVYLYVRSSDYLADGTLIGTIVMDGEELNSTRGRRLAYVAMAGNGTVIGVSRWNSVKDFVMKQGGSFFRQFLLVSNGALPRHFYLHGKVERRALGRIGDALYVVCTRHKETMWDFADALREYGFADAVYITGGNDRTFYRTADGVAHEFGVDDSHAENIPWLVFKAQQ